MNKNETLVLKALTACRTDAGLTWTELAARCWPAKANGPKARARQAGSWARNALRRLVAGRLVRRVADGTYRRVKPKKAVARPAAVKSEKPKEAKKKAEKIEKSAEATAAE